MVLFSRDCYDELLGFLIVVELNIDTRIDGALESYRENCTKIAAFEPFLSLQSLSSRFNDRAAVDMISTAK